MTEINRLTDLIECLRGQNLHCVCAAKTASECCCPTFWPESFCNEAADAIELLRRELKCANELWEQQKELALEYLDDIEKANARIVELEAHIREKDEFSIILEKHNEEQRYRKKLHLRVKELEAALKPFADEADEYEGLGVQNKDQIFVPFAACRQARKVLGDKSD